MNNNLFEAALKIINTMTVAELEGKLQEFGIDCVRKVSCYNESEFVDAWERAGFEPAIELNFENFSSELVSGAAANDGSYMMAA
ncbi:hypothetical protein [Glaciimonas soli]|uniref:Nif11 domain-containing protein n=1 Tax=Glaciimonas soli TaxID=2590999 RepID=A0A843YRA4_9BURK|nr:hypothetical protein [Glaciimonas soli]MQR01650.1 hypothetical protein [Glaciimonas soli]